MQRVLLHILFIIRRARSTRLFGFFYWLRSASLRRDGLTRLPMHSRGWNY